MERRSAKRIVKHDRLQVGLYPSATESAHLVNLSARGALVHAGLAVASHSVVRCRLLQQDGSRVTVFDLTGYVVWRNEHGFAIQWDDTSAMRVSARLLPAQESREAPAAAADSRTVGGAVEPPTRVE